jgi:riboflavin kinase/FMN adenylyltransferase
VIATTGLDYVAVLPFTRQLADHSAEQFVDLLLRERFGMTELLIGHDHGFGRGRGGDVETLRAMGGERGFVVDVVAPVEMKNGQSVSSTRIRQAVARGDLVSAAAGLGRRYSVVGVVMAGEARGRVLGYPTINVEPESSRKLLPPDGVYAVMVETPLGRFGGMMNLGGRPTFGDERRSIEVHLFDAAGDFYGRCVQVSFVARLRDVQRFDGAAALIEQLGRDERDARNALTLPDEPGNLKGSMHVLPSTQ